MIATTEEEQTGQNPSTFLVETNIWTVPHSFYLSPSHYGHCYIATHFYFEKPLKQFFFQYYLFKESDVMGSLSLQFGGKMDSSIFSLSISYSFRTGAEEAILVDNSSPGLN